MFPSPNFEKFFPDIEISAEGTAAEPVNESRSSCIRIGGFSVVRRIIEDYKLAEYLKRWDDRGKGLLLNLAAYSVIAESNMAQHFPDYAYNHPLMTSQNKIYSDATISRFICKIDGNDRGDFLNSWNATHDKRVIRCCGKKTDGLEIAVSRQKKQGCSPTTDCIPVSYI